MKAIEITYDVRRGSIVGETSTVITVMGYVADNLIATGKSGLALNRIEEALRNLEMLKGRMYIPGSIKDFREA